MPTSTSPGNEKSKPGSFLYVETSRAEKGAWVRAANKANMKLVEWVTKTLNEKANSDLGEAERFAKPSQSNNKT